MRFEDDLERGWNLGVQTIVYKLGGSLLDLSDLAARLTAVFKGKFDSRALLIVGGGKTADLVRDWDRIHHLGEERSHWLALEAMVFNALLLQKVLPNSRMVSSRDGAELAWESSLIPILNPLKFLQAEERVRTPLPHDWSVTSDSMAAWVTFNWPAEKLVLLKSVDRPVSLDGDQLGQFSDSDAVDGYFRQLATRLSDLEWINLRSENSFVGLSTGGD